MLSMLTDQSNEVISFGEQHGHPFEDEIVDIDVEEQSRPLNPIFETNSSGIHVIEKRSREGDEPTSPTKKHKPSAQKETKMESTGENSLFPSVDQNSNRELTTEYTNLEGTEKVSVNSENSMPQVQEEEEDISIVDEPLDITNEEPENVVLNGSNVTTTKVESKFNPQNWESLGLKFLIHVFSVGSLNLKDLKNCLLVCKNWYETCSKTNLLWKVVCLNSWRFGGKIFRDMNIEEEKYNWKVILRNRSLLSVEVEYRIDHLRSELSPRLHDTSSTATHIDEIQNLVLQIKKLVHLKEKMDRYEGLVSSTGTPRAPLEEDLYFLVNNVFFVETEDELKFKVIGKTGTCISFTAYREGESLVLSTGDTELAREVKDTFTICSSQLSDLKNGLSLSNISESHLFFFLWRYCLLSTFFGGIDEISLCDQKGWSVADRELFSQIPQQQSAKVNEQEEEEVDIL